MRLHLLTLLLVAFDSACVAAQTVNGPATVIDGDTLEINGERIRIVGIDACESRQKASLNGQEWPCGVMATAWMVERTLGKETHCTASKRDRYKRLLAVCRVNGEDLGAGIIRDGLAVAYRYRDKVSNPEYLSIEEEARKAHRGLWGSEFKMPWDWRKR